MAISRRKVLKGGAALGALSLSGEVFAPALAQNKPLRIGILGARSGIGAGPGTTSIRASEWAAERFNAQGGIAAATLPPSDSYNSLMRYRADPSRVPMASPAHHPL